MKSAPHLAIDPFDDAFLSDPYAHHAALRDAGAVVWLDAIDVYAMARHADVAAALRDHTTYCSGRGVGLADFAHEAPWRPTSLLLETDPPTHERTRRLMNGIATLGALKAKRGEWRARAETLVDGLLDRGSSDAVAELGQAFPLAVFPDLIGLPLDGREHLLTYAAATFNAFGPRNDILARSEADAAEAFDWIAAACRRENLSDDGWGSAVYAAADVEACTPAEAERLVRSFLSAGVDTTVNGIGHMILALATHPDAWAALRADPGLAKRAFEESLRWDSTVQTFFRTTTRAVEVDGTTVPEGAKVLLFLAAANRDPRRWDHSDDYDITRPTSGHVGFGFGIHQCLGQMVARQEAEVLLDVLVRRCRSIRLAGPPERRLNNTLHALERLPIEVQPA